MHIRWRVIAVALICLSTASSSVLAEEIETDVFASMTGKCSTLKVADRAFGCSTVAFSHSPGGRSGFTVPLNDPDDDSHILTFSGENGRRDQDNLYTLTIDRVLLKSKDRPKVEGLPMPSVELSTGTCKQVGNLAAQQVSSISCAATDRDGRTYELQFESDGSPIKVRMILEADAASEGQPRTPAEQNVLAEHMQQVKCGQMAIARGILPRDRTDFILQCMEE